MLLTDPNYFNVPHSEVGTAEGNILFYATLVAVCVSVAIGYTYDMFGRKNLIAGSLFSLVILIWTLPYVPTMGLLLLNRACC
jgi:MFS family permease